VSIPEHGTHLSAAIRFPRSTEISLKEEIVEFVAAAGPLKFHEKFKLSPMVYQGNLEL